MISEVWKDIEGFEDVYQISNFGNVRNKLRDSLFTLKKKENGYIFIGLFKSYDKVTKKKKYKNCYVHRLVGLHFIPNPENKKTINHIDGNKANNIITNLEWNTYSENERHKKRVLKKESGYNHYASKLNRTKLSKIRNLISEGKRPFEIAKQFDVAISVISDIKHNKKYKYC